MTKEFKENIEDDAYIASVNKRNKEIEEKQHAEDKIVLINAICNINFIIPEKEAELKQVNLLDENGIWIKANLEALKDETLIKLYLAVKPSIPGPFSFNNTEDTHVPSIILSNPVTPMLAKSKIEIFQQI